MNARGDIVGQYGHAGQHAFLLRKGKWTTFDAPGAVATRARHQRPGRVRGELCIRDLAVLDPLLDLLGDVRKPPNGLLAVPHRGETSSGVTMNASPRSGFAAFAILMLGPTVRAETSRRRRTSLRYSTSSNRWVLSL